MSEIQSGATWRITQGDARSVLATWQAGSVQTVITSPPYWRLRSYGTPPQIWGGDGECAHNWDTIILPRAKQNRQHLKEFGERIGCGGGIKHSASNEHYNGSNSNVCSACGAWRGELGSEPTLDQYVANLVTVFRAVHRVLRADGTLWLNIGDSYSNAGRAGSRGSKRGAGKPGWTDGGALGDKQLLLIPARVALALQADGWILRSAIVWDKPNAMPESAKDRPSKSYEMLYLFSKQGRYYYDAAAIHEPNSDNSHMGHTYKSNAKYTYVGNGHSGLTAAGKVNTWDGRNARDVWRIATEAFPGAHFATMPTALVERCILAGSRPGDLVGDPFTGSGTVGVVALRQGRSFAGAELKAEYVIMAEQRIINDAPLFNHANRAAVPALVGI
jgi:DNA modification methylase